MVRVRTIARAERRDTIINYVSKERLDQLSETHATSGRDCAGYFAYDYSTVDEILARAEEKVRHRSLLSWIMWKIRHNLGAIIRTANLAGAHGVIIQKRRAVGLTSTVAKTSGRCDQLYTSCQGDKYCKNN